MRFNFGWIFGPRGSESPKATDFSLKFRHSVYYDDHYRDQHDKPTEWWIFDDTMEYLCALSTALNAPLKCVKPTDAHQGHMIHRYEQENTSRPGGLPTNVYVRSEWHPRYGWRCVGFEHVLPSDEQTRTVESVWRALRTFPGYDDYKGVE